MSFGSDTQTDDSDDDGDLSTSTTFTMDDLQAEIDSLKDQYLDLKKELEQSKNETAAAVAELEKIKTQSSTKIYEIKKQAAEQLALSRLGLERFGSDDAAIRFYTGFPSYKHMKFFFDFVRPCAEGMTYCYASGERDNRPGSRNMLLIDELFMFCVRLKLGLFELDLAHRFNIHISSVSRKLITWTNFLYFLLGSQVIWPSREMVQKFMPEGFKNHYKSTRVILDCTEIFAQTPTSLLLQSQLYSSYKSNTTLKGLVGITPYGAICFVSSLYTGGISDKEITRCSGILDLLEPGDSVMADKGFDIEDLLKDKGVELNIPPFLESQNQFSARDVQKTKTIASLRIHVERAIRRIKEFHFFDCDVPLSTIGTANQLYTVACLLTNFQGPLILSNNKGK